MKMTILALSLTMFTAGTVFTSCNSPKDKVDKSKADLEKAQQDLERAHKDYVDQYNIFKLESDAKISANEKLIVDLKAYAKNKKQETRMAYEKTISNLEEKNKALNQKIQEYKEEDLTKWESFKTEFNHDMDELGKALKDLTLNNTK